MAEDANAQAVYRVHGTTIEELRRELNQILALIYTDLRTLRSEIATLQKA